MDAFNPTPPPWTKEATHANGFCCPACQAHPRTSLRVWINRRSPVTTETGRRRWQEFYHCQCQKSWWAWSSDRPPSDFRENNSQSS